MKLKGFVYAIVSAVFFGSAGIFIKSGFTSNFSPVDLLMLQYIIASVILFFMCLARYRKELILSRDMFKKLLIQGVIGNTFMTVFFYSSFKYLEVAVGTMLLYVYPAVVALFSFIFLKEKISNIKIAAIAGTFAGCVLVLDIFSYSLGNFAIKGVIYGLLAAGFYAFMNIYAEKIVSDTPSVVITFYTTIFSLIVLFVINFGFIGKLGHISASSIANAGLLAFFCEIIPLTLLYSAIKYIGPVTTSIISTMELPAAALFSFLILRERLLISQIIGILIIVFSIIMLRREA